MVMPRAVADAPFEEDVSTSAAATGNALKAVVV